jgi:hypothetical protein
MPSHINNRCAHKNQRKGRTWKWEEDNDDSDDGDWEEGDDESGSGSESWGSQSGSDDSGDDEDRGQPQRVDSSAAHSNIKTAHSPYISCVFLAF